jgi:hypothetical protein
MSIEPSDVPHDYSSIHVAKNERRNGCIATGHNIYETLNCNANDCIHKGKRNCVSLRINDILKKKE